MAPFLSRLASWPARWAFRRPYSRSARQSSGRRRQRRHDGRRPVTPVERTRFARRSLRPRGRSGIGRGLTCLKAIRFFAPRRRCIRALATRYVTGFESVYPALTRVDVDAPLAGRQVESVSGARQAPADGVLRRSDPAHAHAHARQLAPLPAGRTLAAPASRHAHRPRHRCVRRRRLQHPRSPSSSTGAALTRHRQLAGSRPRPARPQTSIASRRGGACAPTRTTPIADALLNQRVARRHRQRLQVGDPVRARASIR